MILENSIHENKAAFISKVEQISSRLNIPANWLMAVMFKESGLNHRAVNSTSGATGLIQFMPATAAALGTTTAQLKAISNVEQLEFVYKYLRPYRFKYKSYVDVYLAVFFPAAIGKDENYILQTSNLSAALIASQNKALDTDNSNSLTKKEVEFFALAGFDPQTTALLKKKKMISSSTINIIHIVLLILLVAVLIYKTFN